MEGVFAVYPNYIIYGMCISTSILSMEGVFAVYPITILSMECVSVHLYYPWKLYRCIISILSMEGVSVYPIYIIYGRCILVS